MKKQKQTSNEQTQTDKKNSIEEPDFPIVGIGASAGGLEALEEFFGNLPLNPGSAFVVIQHLSPDYKSLMDELLARHTKMKIHKVEDGMPVEINQIYLIPPKMNMTIFHKRLYLTEHQTTRTLNLPIDIFLRSLAKDQEKNAIAIILSGTGSDGTLGIRAIKEFGGTTMVQDDRSAKFDGMPRSSISTGMVDFILPPARLAVELVNYIKHPFINQKKQIEILLNNDESQLQKVLSIIRETKNVDFTHYKENTIIRRLEKRISINRYENIDDYVRFFVDNKREINILFNEFLIGVTRFFRDEEAFKSLKKLVIEKLIEKHSGTEIRLWVPACSTGEEVYSLAILFSEYVSDNNLSVEIKIFATDIDVESLEYAGLGVYPDNIVSDVTPERLSRFFTKRENRYQIKDNIRSMVIFAKHNLLSDPPFSKIDLISCRNLLIYLKPITQQKVLSLFHMSIRETGYMFLGSSESLGALSEGFNVVDNKSKIYQRISDFQVSKNGNIALSSERKTLEEIRSFGYSSRLLKNKGPLFNNITDDILKDFLPPSVIIDENFEIIHTVKNVNRYLTIPVGQASLNILKMLPRELALVVNSLIRRTEHGMGEMLVQDGFFDENKIAIAISCKKLTNNKTEDVYFLISFSEKLVVEETEIPLIARKVDIKSEFQERIDELEKLLQFKSESLQATVEELETSNEELQSSNEELIASNEELQSTNEELQSVNEELYTVNSEHIRKIEEITELYSDMDNLLKTTEIGTLFLDNDLTIRKINEVASNLTNIMPYDIGRPLIHLSLHLLPKEFIHEVTDVAQTLNSLEKEIWNKDKSKCFLMRILPYRTVENAINGIIITFVEISKVKESQNQILQLTQRLNIAMNVASFTWWEWDVIRNVVVAGEAKYSMLGYQFHEIESGYEGWTKLIHPGDYQLAMDAMLSHLYGENEFYKVEYRIRHKSGNYVWFRDIGKIVERSNEHKPEKLMGVVINITAEKGQEEHFTDEIQKMTLERKSAQLKYNILFETMVQGVVFQNIDGKIIDANPSAERILGVSLNEMMNMNSESAQWKALRIDKTEFPGQDHPAMKALADGKIYKDVIMGVYNPSKSAYVWIKITAVPLFDLENSSPQKVYTIFEEIDI